MGLARVYPFSAITPIVNVLDKGARVDGTTNDTAAFQAAFDEADARNGTVFLPEGTCELTGGLTIDGSVTIQGEGIGKTFLTHAAVTTLFNITAANGSTVVFKDLEVTGPTGAAFDNGAVCINWVASGFTSCLRLERVKVTGTFDHAAMRSGGGRLEVHDCHLEATDVPLAFFEATNTANSAYALLTGTTFTTPNGDLTALGSVGFYVHPHIAADVIGCTFQTIGRYGIYQNGTPSADRRDFTVTTCRFINCGLAQTKRTGKTLFANCVINGNTYGVASNFFGEVLLSNCSFALAKDQVFNSAAVNQSIWNTCWFDNTAIVLAGASGSYHTFHNCRYRRIDPPVYAAQISNTSDAQEVRVIDCEFIDETTTGDTHSAYYDTRTNSVVEIKDCRFKNWTVRYNSVGQIVLAAGSRYTIEGNVFENGYTIAINTWALAAGILEGSIGNRFIGSIRVGDYDSINNQQRMVRRAGVSPTPVASAASIDTNTSAFLSYDTHVVTGAAAIANLTNPWPCAGILRLVVAAAGTWSTANTGNITPLTTAARTAGTVVTLLWEPTAASWLEV